jgi:hypothetical protein
MRGRFRFASLGLALIAGLALSLTAAPAAFAGGPFSDWAAIVIAGDWHAHSGEPSEVFDNARRDLTKAFVSAGFSPNNISQFSVRPERYPKETVLKSAQNGIVDRLTTLAKQAPGGCLIYFTSHGAPTGVVLDQDIWGPNGVGTFVDAVCGSRPTVVVVSACFSGVFVPALEGPNRMVLTAARPDRTSFGCGQQDRYTYFDGCFLQSMPQAHDFTGLALATRECVAQLEIATQASPPSEPQIAIGAQLRPMLPLYAFQAPPDRTLASARTNPAH